MTFEQSEQSTVAQTIDHLFRHESGKMVAVLTRTFGTHNLDLVEDVVQETLLQALEQWKFSTVPENPTGWLFKVAKHKALDAIRRKKFTTQFAEDVSPLLSSEYTVISTLDSLINESEIEDEQLRMMFVCSHPSLSSEAQITLILKTLCGFSTIEIARAFLSNEETITKRLFRAKEIFREKKIRFELPKGEDLSSRLENVLTVIYLLFNEGYNSTQSDELIREDLIGEALRLCHLLSEHNATSLPATHALMALLCFHTARIPSRLNDLGQILILKNQDRSKWNPSLIQIGTKYFNQSMSGDRLSSFHFEAAIAYEHCLASHFSETNWNQILHYYNLLFELTPSPIVALNRAIVIGELYGAQAGLNTLEQIDEIQSLKKFYLFYATKGDFYLKLDEKEKAKQFLKEARTLTVSKAEQDFLDEKIRSLEAS